VDDRQAASDADGLGQLGQRGIVVGGDGLAEAVTGFAGEGASATAAAWLGGD